MIEPKTLLHIILTITVSSYLFEQLLDYVNLRFQRADMPDDVKTFYDEDKYRRSLSYHRELTRFSFITSAVSFVASVVMLGGGFFGTLDGWLRRDFDSPIVVALAFFGLIFIASDLLGIPWQLYRNFVIEEKYGFNRTTVRLFFADKVKGYLLTCVFGGSLLSLLIWMSDVIGPSFWIWFSITSAILILAINVFYASLILPLFNKLTPLENGTLRTAIQDFAHRVGFPLDSIFIIDGSKRSSKANAFFSGIGNRKKIVLYDTLINNHTTEELVAILAHEVGHYKKKHIIWGLFLSIFQITFTLFVLSKMMFSQSLSLALGADQVSAPVNLIAFGILFSPILSMTGLFMKIYSQKNEYEAGAFASDNYSGESLSSALKKLSVDNLSELYPHPWYVFFHYSHPPLMSRLEAISARTS